MGETKFVEWHSKINKIATNDVSFGGGRKKCNFFPLRFRSENPHFLLYFSSFSGGGEQKMLRGKKSWEVWTVKNKCSSRKIIIKSEGYVNGNFLRKTSLKIYFLKCVFSCNVCVNGKLFEKHTSKIRQCTCDDDGFICRVRGPIWQTCWPKFSTSAVAVIWVVN